jgi:hypothetical protein
MMWRFPVNREVFGVSSESLPYVLNTGVFDILLTPTTEEIEGAYLVKERTGKIKSG